MSFLLRTSRLAAVRPVDASRTFMSSSVRATQKESNNPEQNDDPEKHKQDLLKKQKEGKGHWKPELASNSEEAVKADRHAHNESIEEMQKKTAKHAEQKVK